MKKMACKYKYDINLKRLRNTVTFCKSLVSNRCDINKLLCNE
jgi:hypothetical protein